MHVHIANVKMKVIMQKVNARDESPMNGLFEVESMQEGSSQVGTLICSLYRTVLPVKEEKVC